MISDEAVEAAARSEYELEFLALEGAWGEATEGVRALFMRSASAALTAAAPFIAAQAWDEGAKSNREYELEYRARFDYGDELPEPPDNPYRSGK